MNKKLKSSFVSIMFAFALAACNADQGKNENVEASEQVKIAALTEADQKTIKENFVKSTKGQVKIEDIVKVAGTPLPGIYEIAMGPETIFYVNKEVSYLLAGELVDIKSQKSLTAETAKELSIIDYSKLPLDKAIKEVKGKGTLKVAVFSDPDCPFCKDLEKNFASMDDVTIYTFLFPIEQLHPQAKEKSQKIWCSKDRVAAWTDWMRKGVEPTASPDCDNPVADTIALGQKMGVNGTPVMAFPNGKTIPGLAAQGEELKKLIADNQK